MKDQLPLQKLQVLDSSNMREALRVIDRNARGVAFVVDKGGVLRGVVTDGDIRRAILKGLSADAPVTELMTRSPVTAKLGVSAERLMGLMSDKIKYIPIVDDKERVVDYATFAHAFHLPLAAPAFQGNELRYVMECVLTNWISSQGRFVTEFERAFAKFSGVKHGVAVSNGTVALHLSLVLAGIGPGDEVIVPSLTFVATANAVRHAGATPVFVDSEPHTWTLDPLQIEQKITKRTKAIIPVHLYGHPADMDPIMELARRHQLTVIEDAAEAHGALYKGKRVGSIGHIGCFSFYGNKIITTGEGGMLTTNDGRLADQARILRDHGMSKTRKYWHEVVGFNYRLTNLQAAVGVAQIERVEMILTQRAGIAARYQELLAGDERLELPVQASWAERVTWIYSVLLKDGADRDAVVSRLEAQGIDARPLFQPIHLMPPYATGERLPVAEVLSRRGLSLPTWVPMGRAEIDRVCTALREALPGR
jgi:perosamine synthetase